MNVAFITFEYPPFIIGGAGVYSKAITQEIAKLGHRVIVFTPDMDGNVKSEYNNLKIIKIRINKNLPFKALQFWLRLPLVIRKMDKVENFDLIHINGISYFLIQKILGVPHIMTVHHLVSDAFKSNKPSLLSKILDVSGENGFFMQFVEKISIKNVDKIIAVSKYTKKRILNNYDLSYKKIDVIYNGIYLDKFIIENKEFKIDADLKDKKIILFVGRVNDIRKGLDLLLRAFKTMQKTFKSYLIVIGSGDQKKALNLSRKLGIQDKVIFKGYLNDNELSMYYSFCDIYVCPSRLEGFGLTVLEAMAFGKPIAAFNVGALPELIINGHNGILVKKNDINELSNALAYLLDNGKLDWSSQERKNYLKENFNWKKSAKELEKIYGLMVKNNE